jgi:hypothetical protein
MDYKNLRFLFYFSFQVSLKPDIVETLQFVPSISQILNGVKNRDVRILWNGRQEFKFDSKQQFWPTTSTFVTDFFNKCRVKRYYGYTINIEDAKHFQKLIIFNFHILISDQIQLFPNRWFKMVDLLY